MGGYRECIWGDRGACELVGCMQVLVATERFCCDTGLFGRYFAKVKLTRFGNFGKTIAESNKSKVIQSAPTIVCV